MTPVLCVKGKMMGAPWLQCIVAGITGRFLVALFLDFRAVFIIAF